MEKKQLKEVFEIADYLDEFLKAKGFSDCKVDIDNGKIIFTTFKTQRYYYKSLIEVYFDKKEEQKQFDKWLMCHFADTTSRKTEDWIDDICNFLKQNHMDVKFGENGTFEKSLRNFIKKY